MAVPPLQHAPRSRAARGSAHAYRKEQCHPPAPLPPHHQPHSCGAAVVPWQSGAGPPWWEQRCHKAGAALCSPLSRLRCVLLGWRGGSCCNAVWGGNAPRWGRCGAAAEGQQQPAVKELPVYPKSGRQRPNADGMLQIPLPPRSVWGPTSPSSASPCPHSPPLLFPAWLG